MGFSILSSSVVDKDYTMISGNPNPKNFVILSCEQCGNSFVSLVKYPDCKNFEGLKILVTRYNPKMKTLIDPHFFPNSGLIARLEPTGEGMKLAIIVANNS